MLIRVCYLQISCLAVLKLLHFLAVRLKGWSIFASTKKYSVYVQFCLMFKYWMKLLRLHLLEVSFQFISCFGVENFVRIFSFCLLPMREEALKLKSNCGSHPFTPSPLHPLAPSHTYTYTRKMQTHFQEPPCLPPPACINMVDVGRLDFQMFLCNPPPTALWMDIIVKPPSTPLSYR